ncbi:MAG: NYN domain-containing protein, partial [Jatrophihabitans sp.]
MDDELPEPVRGRALTLAADLLGRLDADAVPASLRAIARFTPSKRRRLGTAAVGVALERDDDFRAALAELLRKDDPALLEKLEQGDMPDGDPLAAAAIAWLVRPEGWCEVVATAVERSATAPAADAGELAELRAEVG